MNQIIFHVGFPKTGSTTLQAKIFPKLESIHYLGKFPESRPSFSEAHRQFFEQIIHSSEIEFDTRFSEIKNKAVDLFQLKTKGVKLFSHEGFIRNTNMSKAKKKYQDIYRTLSRMQKIFDGLEGNQFKLMVTIRKQEDLLPSYFAEFYRDEQAVNGYHNFKQFLDHHLNQDSPCSFPDSLKYFQLYQHLTTILPSENVLVIPCEGLFAADKKVISLLADFLTTGNPSPFSAMQSQHLNARSDSNHQWLKKRYRRVHKYNQKLGKLISKPFLIPIQSLTHVTLSVEEKQEIQKAYHNENKQINEKIGGILEPFGYC